MKNILSVSVVALVLVAVVTGCGGMHRYDARLAAADSLMHDVPDSALALVQAVDPASLTREGDRAYRDLLLTQARYRCYITATSDSDINRALAYYLQHDGEREKLTRAYIYKGAVMEELGHPDSAMLYYKQAEAIAAPDDYFNLGYSNLRIAQLYQSLYTNDSAAYERIIHANYYFSLINDTTYSITTLGTIGALLCKSDKDSAQIYLEKAISLAQAINSPKRFKYQSKLSGLYFYKGNYEKAKNIAMNIIKNSKDVHLDEILFYYYAARSFIKLSRLDSAYYIKSLIPVPVNSLDSMNQCTLLAELAWAEHRHKDYNYYLARSKDINDKIYQKSLKSRIVQVELKWDADLQYTKYRKKIHGRIVCVSFVILLIAILLSLCAIKIIKKRILVYQNDLQSSQNELENTITLYEAKLAELESIMDKQKEVLTIKDNTLQARKKEEYPLQNQQFDISEQVANIVRYRLSALNEVYYDIRIKSDSKSSTNKYPIPLMSLIKELNDKKQLTYISPRRTFWEKLKRSVEGEYPGITTFVEQNCQSTKVRDHQLFWLLCAKVSPQIIKLCMNYSSTVTVSNYKRTIIKELMGLDLKFDQFIQLYLDRQFDQLIKR